MDDRHAELLLTELRETNRYLNRLAKVLIAMFGDGAEGYKGTRHHHCDTGFIEDGVVLPGHNE